MKYLLALLLIITTVCSCAATQLDPQTEQEIIQIEEYDRIIALCEDAFYGQRSDTIFCVLINFKAMNKTVRLYVDGEVTANEYRDCHKSEYYYPEYETFWYVDVLECMEGDTNE